MDTPLYKLSLLRRSAQYFSAAPGQIAAHNERIAALQNKLGVRDLFHADMSWSNEKYESLAVEYFPSLQALREYAHCAEEMRYAQGDSYLGIPMDNSTLDFSDDAPGMVEEAVYRVYFSRPAPQAHLVPPQQGKEIYTHMEETARMLGVKGLLSAYMRWNDEGWEYFGLERFPDLETLVSYSQYLTQIGWYRLTEAVSYLATARGGLVADEGGC